MSNFNKVIVFGFLITMGIVAAGENLALKKPTIPSDKANMVDGTSAGCGFGTGGSFYIDMGAPVAVGRVAIAQSPGHLFADSLALLASDDANTWVPVWKGTEMLMFLEFEEEFTPITKRYFKFDFQHPTSCCGSYGINVDEVELFAPNSTGPNVALNKTVTTNLTGADNLAKITDGSYKEDWFEPGLPCSLTVDLGATTNINRIRFLSDTHNDATSSFFMGSMDKKTWTEIAPPTDFGSRYFSFPEASYRYVMCVVTRVQATDGQPSVYVGAHIREIQIYAPAGGMSTSIANQNARIKNNLNVPIGIFGKTKDYNLNGQKLIQKIK